MKMKNIVIVQHQNRPFTAELCEAGVSFESICREWRELGEQGTPVDLIEVRVDDFYLGYCLGLDGGKRMCVQICEMVARAWVQGGVRQSGVRRHYSSVNNEMHKPTILATIQAAPEREPLVC